MEEREAKMMHLEASLEEKQHEQERQQERQHEERMQAMFFSFMQTMIAGSNMPVPQPSNPFYPPYYSHSHLPSFSLTPLFPPATSSTPQFLPSASSTPPFPHVASEDTSIVPSADQMHLQSPFTLCSAGN